MFCLVLFFRNLRITGFILFHFVSSFARSMVSQVALESALADAKIELSCLLLSGRVGLFAPCPQAPASGLDTSTRIFGHPNCADSGSSILRSVKKMIAAPLPTAPWLQQYLHLPQHGIVSSGGIGCRRVCFALFFDFHLNHASPAGLLEMSGGLNVHMDKLTASGRF